MDSLLDNERPGLNLFLGTGYLESTSIVSLTVSCHISAHADWHQPGQINSEFRNQFQSGVPQSSSETQVVPASRRTPANTFIPR